MEEVDIAIIGAGVVGLSIASRVAKKNKNVVLVERHDGFGEETSSRNSEVIHAGIYYPEGSLKAKLCVEGNGLLYQICEENSIPYKRIGKLIVAINEEQVNGLEGLLEKGRKSRARDIKIISSKEVQKIEPHINARAAILSPSSGIIDSHRLMKYFEVTAKNNNASITYGCEVKTIEKTPKGYQVGIEDTDGETFFFLTKILVNSAGLESSNIAALAGINIEEAGYQIHYCKGEYFQVGKGKHKLAHRLVYPFPPQPGSVGIHTVPDLAGMMKLGPYDYFVESIDYNVDEAHKELFYESVRSFLPFVEFQDLEPDMAGIHPKIQKAGELMRDFVIVHEEGKGLHGLINLIGIESPGLTSSPAIGRFVENMIEEII